MTIKYPAAPKAARGRPRLAVSEKERARLYRLYVVEGLAVRDVAARLRIPEANVRRRLRAAGIEARSNARRSGIERIDHGALFSDIVLLGVGGAAVKHGVSRRTLTYYIARLRREAKGEK